MKLNFRCIEVGKGRKVGLAKIEEGFAVRFENMHDGGTVKTTTYLQLTEEALLGLLTLYGAEPECITLTLEVKADGQWVEVGAETEEIGGAVTGQPGSEPRG